MKTLQTQFNLIQEGKGHKDVFLKEAKRLLMLWMANFNDEGEYNEVKE